MAFAAGYLRDDRTAILPATSRFVRYHQILIDRPAFIVVAGMEGALPSVVGGLVKVPVIAVPTTAGTGSEVTPIAIVTMPNGEKQGVVSRRLYADVAVLDATLTLGLSARVTAMTGINAMVHAIEAYTSRHAKNVLSDTLATRALRLLSDHIVTAIADGSNLEARRAMLQGSMLAGMAFANAPVGAVHALAYPLGGNYHIPHGLSNSLVLPHVLRFNAPWAGELYAELAAIILPDQELPQDPVPAAEILADYFLGLAEKLGLQTRLEQMNIAKTDLPMLAEEAMLQQRLLINNPREVSLDDALTIYQQAF